MMISGSRVITKPKSPTDSRVRTNFLKKQTEPYNEIQQTDQPMQILFATMNVLQHNGSNNKPQEEIS